MSASAVELQPTVPEVLQAEPAGTEPIIKVAQQGPVKTQSLPRKGGATFTKTAPALSSTQPATQVLRADHRRASAIILAAAAILVAYGDANAQDPSTMALWPANVPLPVSGTVDVWVAAAAGTTTVSVLTELWATGEGSD